MEEPREYPNRYDELKSLAARMFNVLSGIAAYGTYDKERGRRVCPSCRASWEFGRRHLEHCDLEGVLSEYRRF